MTQSTLLAGQKGQLTQETELLESLIEKVEDHVAHSSKTDLIKRSEELLMMFKQVKPALNFFYPQPPLFWSFCLDLFTVLP